MEGTWLLPKACPCRGAGQRGPAAPERDGRCSSGLENLRGRNVLPAMGRVGTRRPPGWHDGPRAREAEPLPRGFCRECFGGSAPLGSGRRRAGGCAASARRGLRRGSSSAGEVEGARGTRWRFSPRRCRDPSAPSSVWPPLFSKELEFASTYRKPTARKNPIVAQSRLLVLIFEKLPQAPHPSPLLQKALGCAPERCHGRLKASYPADRINSPFLPTQASKRKRTEADKPVIAFWLALVRLPPGLRLERQSRHFRGEQ